MDESKEAVHELIKKAKETTSNFTTDDANNALKYSQAACNVANALATLKIHELENKNI